MENSQVLNFRPSNVFFLLLILTAMAPTEPSSNCTSGSGPVVPTIPLLTFLERVQETALNTFGNSTFDPKLYIDLSLKFDLSTTEEAFNKLPRSQNGSVSVKDLEGFIEEYFEDAGADLVYVKPADFLPEPAGFLPKVENPEVRAWALEVHSLWKNLSRKVSNQVAERPEFHTLLPLPQPGMIPGSRFRELYYWDSYWVIRGLLASKMYETAKGIVTNLISLLDEYGYVLNGARAYYTNRSQPPLLSSMIYDLYNQTDDIEIVKKSLPALLKEHHFWNSGIHKVTIQDAQSCNHTLSRYYAMWNKPRPESSTIDKESASKLLNVSEKELFYRELASAAESGWDFSTRWMRNTSDFTTLAITSIIPVDLNAFLLKMELDIAFLAKVIEENDITERFLEASQARQKAMNSVLWNVEMGQWLDYWLDNRTTCMVGTQTWESQNQNQKAFASNFVPLWIDLYNSAMAPTEASSNCTSGSGPVVHTIPLLAFLERVQETALNTFGKSNFDPKRYIDSSLKSDLSTTEEAFNKLPRSQNGSVSVEDLEEFIEDYLEDAGADLVYVEPTDFVPEPAGFLPKVENPEVRAWALEVHSLWKNLSRKVSSHVTERPELHTLLPLPQLGMIPGSRYRELYYWDSYWVIRGLLASKMYETAKGIMTNLISLLDEYGYVLNGARAYYTNRSQPPLLSSMIYDLYNSTGDIEIVKKSLPALLKEHHFWNSGIHKVTIRDAQACNHTLSRYYAMWNKPRPESSTIDKNSASKLLNVSEKELFYREVASAAESGWDFSTRWMRNISDFTTLATTSIIPVDLNAFLLKMELDIFFLAKVTGENGIAEGFLEASQARQKAMKSILWNAEMGQWLDYWLDNSTTCEESQTWESQNQNQKAFASNFVPLWIDLYNSDGSVVEKVMKSLRTSGLLCAAGIATSLTNSGQQWDFPNGWAPLQHMIVEGLVRSGSKEARSLAEDIAVRWIRANYAAYKKMGTMYEKYDVEECGKVGGGGEYRAQTGFGWSNGVVLAFLEEFGWPQDQKLDCQ